MKPYQCKKLIKGNIAELSIFVDEFITSDLLPEKLELAKKLLNIQLRYLQHLIERVSKYWKEQTECLLRDVEDIKALRAKIKKSDSVKNFEKII